MVPRCRFGRIAAVIRIGAIVLVALRSAAADEPLISSKWAMDIEDYARTYSVPYSDDPATRRSQVFREMLDARFQEDNYGFYVGGGAAANNWSVGQIDVGMFQMPTAWSTVRLGGIGMVAGGKAMGGVEGGIRLHTATRLAPYVGLQGVLEFGGFARHISYNRYYYQDGQRYNNPRWGYFPTGMAAIVPEMGVSYWLNPYTRLNVGAGYYITGGHQPDFLLLSTSLDFSLREAKPVNIYIPPPDDPTPHPDPYFIPSGHFTDDEPSKASNDPDRLPAILQSIMSSDPTGRPEPPPPQRLFVDAPAATIPDGDRDPTDNLPQPLALPSLFQNNQK